MQISEVSTFREQEIDCQKCRRLEMQLQKRNDWRDRFNAMAVDVCEMKGMFYYM